MRRVWAHRSTNATPPSRSAPAVSVFSPVFALFGYGEEAATGGFSMKFTGGLAKA